MPDNRAHGARFLLQRQQTDRIMAGQNHHIWQNLAAPPFMVLPAIIPSLLRMILSCHDSVFLDLVAAWLLCVSLRVSAPLRLFFAAFSALILEIRGYFD